MKNLKRVLSLGLASVMLLGMMVVGASAKDFTDAEDIVHDEAVQTLVALNVIAGKEDGSYFDPKGDVTRGEMAKMITVIMQGGTEVNTGIKSTPSFTDISGHWAEPYIEYCYDLNIISGRGDGTFDPNGKVTGIEATKMVLTALGYDAEAYKLNGAAWASRTDEEARKTGGKRLYENLDSVTLSQPATRDTAAQLLWNGLQAYVVDMAPGQNKNNGEVTWNFNTDREITLLNQRYNANVMLATYTGNHDYKLPDAGINPEKGEIAVKAKLKVNNGKDNEIVAKGKACAFPSDMSIDNISEEVKVVWKNGEKSTDAGPDKNDIIYGVFNTGATRVVRSTLDKVKSNESDKAILNIDGVKYDTVDTKKTGDKVKIVTNYVSSKEVDADTTDGSGKVNAKKNNEVTRLLKFNSGNPIKVVFNDDGLVSTVYVTQTYVAAVTAANSSSVTLNNGIGNVKFDDNDVEEGLVKGDVVAVTPLYGEKIDDCVVTVKKAEKVSGEVTSYKLVQDEGIATDVKDLNDESVTVGGEVYKVSYKNAKSPAVAYLHNAVNLRLLKEIPGVDDIIESFYDKSNEAQDTFIGEDVDLYLVNGYVAAAVQVTNGSNNYSVVTAVKGDTASAGATFNALQLQVMAADGTKEIITVSKDSTKELKRDGTPVADPKHPTHDMSNPGISSADYKIGDIVTYTMNDDDEAEVTIRGLVDEGATAFAYNDKTKTMGITHGTDGNSYVDATFDNGTFATASDCVLFVQTAAGTKGAYDNEKMPNADWEAYDIRQLDKMELSAGRATIEATVALNSDGTKVLAAFVNWKTTPDGASDDTVYGIVSKFHGRVQDYYHYTVQANGEEYDVYYKGDSAVEIKEGNLVKFNPTANNRYAKGKIINPTNVTGNVDSDPTQWGEFDLQYAWVKDYSVKDNTLTIWNSIKYVAADEIFEGVDGSEFTYALDKDVRIVYVDKDGKTSEAESSIDEFSAISGSKNVAFKIKKETTGGLTTNVITVLYVETSNEANVGPFSETKPPVGTSTLPNPVAGNVVY